MSDTEFFELALEYEMPKSYLVIHSASDGRMLKSWIPKSQVKSLTETKKTDFGHPIYEFEISTWIAEKVGLV